MVINEMLFNFRLCYNAVLLNLGAAKLGLLLWTTYLLPSSKESKLYTRIRRIMLVQHMEDEI